MAGRWRYLKHQVAVGRQADSVVLSPHEAEAPATREGHLAGVVVPEQLGNGHAVGGGGVVHRERALVGRRAHRKGGIAVGAKPQRLTLQPLDLANRCQVGSRHPAVLHVGILGPSGRTGPPLLQPLTVAAGAVLCHTAAGELHQRPVETLGRFHVVPARVSAHHRVPGWAGRSSFPLGQAAPSWASHCRSPATTAAPRPWVNVEQLVRRCQDICDVVPDTQLLGLKLLPPCSGVTVL
mmetsp:Transcript_20621/g.57233  ORF Transcript_20621/g.57233 Transcript_20621/m.57233 type:complete len:237 (+) Transcript_20621:822-1532(+)